jgi:hypothetical protein
MKDHWAAFCTIHYFLTGRSLVSRGVHNLAYDWYLQIEDRAFARSGERLP